MNYHDKKYIDDNWKIMSVKDMAAHLKVTTNAIYIYMHRKGYSIEVKKTRGNIWSNEDEVFLLENKSKLTAQELANHLNRSRWAIYAKLREFEKKDAVK